MHEYLIYEMNDEYLLRFYESYDRRGYNFYQLLDCVLKVVKSHEICFWANTGYKFTVPINLYTQTTEYSYVPREYKNIMGVIVETREQAEKIQDEIIKIRTWNLLKN